MKPRAADAANFTRVAALSGLLVAAALSLAVFYQGPQMLLLAGAQFLLVTWVALSLVCGYADGVRIPVTPLSVTLALFWLWLAVSLSWSAVPGTSVINFWWVGSLVLVFWAYTLSPQRERIWFYASRFMVVGALVLCAYALVQRFAWHQSPRSTFINIHSFAALMMLIALPLGGYFMIAWHNRVSKRVLYGFGACLFVLYFTIALTEGRGTSLSILLSLSVFAVIAARAVGRRPVLVLIGLVVGAYAAANLALYGGWGDRMATTLADPASAALPRWLIWRGSWELLMQQPWWGIGLGTYYLAWPPFRDPTDNTLGFFVHNDYLQIWIEAGLPALLLLFAVFTSVFVMLVRLLRRSRATVALKIESLGLFAGLLAVAAHSFVDFNLYILSISIAAGLVLGRFHECVASNVPVRVYTARPARAIQRNAYQTIVILLALFPLLYFVALGTSDYFYRHGLDLAETGDLLRADKAFSRAERLLPRDDKVLTTHADLYRFAISRLPPTDTAQRQSLYEAALAMLDEAQSANPYQALIHVVRGRVLQESPELTGSQWRTQAEAEFAKALDLNPRYFVARANYARLLIGARRERQAYGILNAGVDYWYYPSESVLAYYRLVDHVAKDLGDTEHAAKIERDMDEIRRSIAATVPERPVVSDASLPITASSR